MDIQHLPTTLEKQTRVISRRFLRDRTVTKTVDFADVLRSESAAGVVVELAKPTPRFSPVPAAAVNSVTGVQVDEPWVPSR